MVYNYYSSGTTYQFKIWAHFLLNLLGQQGSYARRVHQLHNGRPRPHGRQQRRGSPSHPRAK